MASEARAVAALKHLKLVVTRNGTVATREAAWRHHVVRGAGGGGAASDLDAQEPASPPTCARLPANYAKACEHHTSTHPQKAFGGSPFGASAAGANICLAKRAHTQK